MVTRRFSNNATSVYLYPYGRALDSIEQRVEQVLKASLMRIAKEVDGNWLKLELSFLTGEKRTREAALQQGRIELDFKPTSAVLNGPRYGDFSLLAHERMQDPDIRTLLMLYSATKSADFTLYNERHRIELIPGRTQLVYEICEVGVVYSVETEGRFTVFITDGPTDGLCEEWLETLRANLDLENANRVNEGLEDSSHLTFTDIRYLNQAEELPEREALQLHLRTGEW